MHGDGRVGVRCIDEAEDLATSSARTPCSTRGCASFPPVFVVSPPAGPARDCVKASIEYAVQQITRVAADHFEAATRVPELMLVEILGLHLASAPAASQGLARAIRDPVLSPALAAIHGSPAEKWTVGSLAQQAHVSISLLGQEQPYSGWGGLGSTLGVLSKQMASPRMHLSPPTLLQRRRR